MKKIAIITVLCSMQLVGQNKKVNNKFYVSLNTGYNFALSYTDGFGTGFLDIPYPNPQESSATEVKKIAPKLNLGAGLNYGGSLGYNYNEFLGFELGVNYLTSKKVDFKLVENGKNLVTNTFNANMLQIKPVIILQAGFNKINPFIKMGMLLGKGSVTMQQNQLSPSDNTFDRRTEVALTGGLSVGYTGTLGVTYQVSNNISLLLDANFINLAFHPNKQTTTFTKFIDSMGVNQLGAVGPPKVIEFVDELPYDANVTIDPNAPEKKAYRPTIEMSTFGINLGIKYGF